MSLVVGIVGAALGLLITWLFVRFGGKNYRLRVSALDSFLRARNRVAAQLHQLLESLEEHQSHCASLKYDVIKGILPCNCGLAKARMLVRTLLGQS